jgi:UDP-N-acetylmuramate: L-alanyl-gamma-D-glutamyl-meso-diaminopimelate ligase
VVAGTHGKTTTASLMAQVLVTAELDPGYLIGGIPRGLKLGHRLGSPPYFVIEGDEYDCAFFDKRPKFVHYRPQTVILTGVEFDHADIYPDMAAVEDAFAQLVAEVPPCGRIVACADSEPAMRLAAAARCSVESYSTSGAPADWRAEPKPAAPGVQELRVTRTGGGADEVAGWTFRVGLTGAHNAANALAVIATARLLGVRPEAITSGLAAFQGVRRRQEVRGVAGGVTVIDDFAHHPTAIRETLDGLRGVHGPGRLTAVFEPRSATTKRAVFQQVLPPALAVADRVVFGGLHAPEKVPEGERLDPERVVRDLRQRGVDATLAADPDAIATYLAATSRPGDTIVVMSSGAFGGLVELLLGALEQGQ